MKLSVYAAKTIGFDSKVETVKLIKNGVEFDLNAEEFDELQAVLAGKRFCLSFYADKSDYRPYKSILCSSADGKQYDTFTHDNY
jgi:hypothetical protein